MHKKLPRLYHFVEDLNINEIKKIHNQIAIIYRNYRIKPDVKKVIQVRNYCRTNRRIFIIANYFHLAYQLNLDGFYIPAHNKNNINKYKKSKFIIIGSAHSIKEIRIKETQGVHQIFLSPIFKTLKSNKNLGLLKFNLFSKYTSKPIIALGGINSTNIKQIKMTNSFGIASIRYIKMNKKFTQIKL
tara:strand:- start:2708 stop:3265 length:558 start_codon:yes stop_codon:yes gene_type:complete